MPGESKDVAVIVVGRDSAQFLEQTLKSLSAADWGPYNYEIIYVDNGSKDGTEAMLQSSFPDVRTIFNSSNLGFCKAANQGARVANCRLLFFLNDDTVVLDGAIRKLAEFLDQSDDASVVGSRLLYPDRSEQWSGRRFPTPLNGLLGRRSGLTRLFPNAKAVRSYLFKDALAGELPFEVDWVSAAAVMFRSKVFQVAGGFAEDYYYFHECVICDRLKKAGHRTFLHPESRIIHYEGFGSGPRPLRVQKWHIVNFHRGAFRFYCEYKNLPFLSIRRCFAATLISLRACALLLVKTFTSLRLNRAGSSGTSNRPEGPTDKDASMFPQASGISDGD
ncbi:MAG: glycosyltransferase family 2 protein [Candidatus Acidiferrum sp.]